MKLSVREAETIIKILTPAYCPIPKQVIILIFISLIFLLFIFPANISDFFSLCYLFFSQKLKTIAFRVTILTAPRVVRSTKLSPVLRDSYLDGWPKTNTPCGNNFSFFSFFFKGDIKTAELPSLVWCDVASSISQLFVPQFAMPAFACICTISYNRTNKQPDPAFEFFSILLTSGRLKQ